MADAHVAAADFVELTADIVSAYVRYNSISAADLPALLRQVYLALQALNVSEHPILAEELRPAVAIKKSITPEFLISLEDGKKFKSLKRHLRTHHNMSPDEYRQRWGLPVDYPMVAPNYSAARSRLAMEHGLGRKPEMVVEVPKRRKRAT